MTENQCNCPAAKVSFPGGVGDDMHTAACATRTPAEETPKAKPIRVRMTLILDVDQESWTLDYGVEGRREIQGDVKEYIRTLMNDTSGGMEYITLVASK